MFVPWSHQLCQPPIHNLIDSEMTQGDTLGTHTHKGGGLRREVNAQYLTGIDDAEEHLRAICPRTRFRRRS